MLDSVQAEAHGTGSLSKHHENSGVSAATGIISSHLENPLPPREQILSNFGMPMVNLLHRTHELWPKKLGR